LPKRNLQSNRNDAGRFKETYIFASTFFKMPDYRIKPDGFNEIRKLILQRLLIVALVVVSFIVVLTIYNAKEKEDYIITLPSTIVLFTVIFGFSIRRTFKKQKELLDSYALTINDNAITRYQLNTPTITLYHTEIKEILKTKNHRFIIKGKNAEDIIYVPSQIGNYQDLETKLEEIKSISMYSTKNLFEKYPVIIIFLILGLMLGVYGSMNKIIVLLCSIPLITIIIWSFLKIQKSKNIESRAKRILWFILIILISIVSVTILKLTGTYKP
jgi:hypothetical protein